MIYTQTFLETCGIPTLSSNGPSPSLRSNPIRFCSSQKIGGLRKSSDGAPFGKAKISFPFVGQLSDFGPFDRPMKLNFVFERSHFLHASGFAQFCQLSDPFSERILSRLAAESSAVEQGCDPTLEDPAAMIIAKEESVSRGDIFGSRPANFRDDCSGAVCKTDGTIGSFFVASGDVQAIS